MKECDGDHPGRRLEEIRSGDTEKGEIHGAPYCKRCGGIITCEFCPPGSRKIASVIDARYYACWEHGDVAFEAGHE